MQKRIIISALVCIILAMSTVTVYAGRDPVSWQLTPSSGFPTTDINSQSVVTYTLTNHLPGPAVMITAPQISGPGITVEDGCNQVRLVPNAACNITVRFSPTAPGTTTFQLIYGYNFNRISLPMLTAVASGSQTNYALSGSIPNFPTSIKPTGTQDFTAVFTNSGASALTNCFAGDTHGNNQFILSPSSTATLTVLSNSCGTVRQPIGLTTSGSTNSCTITGSLSAPYQEGNFTLSAIMHCSQASSSPTISSVVSQPTLGFSGVFTEPSPFPAVFYDNEAPYVTAKFTNTGNVQLTDCYAATATGFSLSPSNAGSIVVTSQPSTCGSLASKIPLGPNSSCYLYGQLTDLQAPLNDVNLTASVVCAEASASPEKTLSIQHSTSSCTSVTVQNALLLPQSTYLYADNVVQFKITNTCLSQSIVLGTVAVVASTGSATITTNPTYDLCSNNTISAGDSCLVTASVIPNAMPNLTVTASVTPVSPSGGVEVTASTSATVLSNQQSTHHLYFVNQCNFDVWYGIGNAAGTSGTASPDPNLTTYPSGAPASAYYLPAQVSGQAPSTIDISVNSYINGAIWPRTGCTMQAGQLVCATGTCTTSPNSGTCVSGTATGNMPLNPITKIEEFLSPIAGADGVYDVSVINGMTVPTQMKALGPLGDNSVGTSPGNPRDVYTCSSAGAIIQPAGSSLLAACSWAFDPSATLTGISNVNSDFYWVTPGADDGCSTSVSPQLCGMAYNVPPPANPGKVNRRNGDFLGFSTLANYTGYSTSSQWGSADLYTIFGMETPLAGYGPPGNYTVLVACIYDKASDTANSCNLNNLPNTAAYEHCCGCVDWTMTTPNTPCGGGSPYWPGTGTNLAWTTNKPAESTVNYTIQEAVSWLKSAAPTTYAYQFDDTSSSFQCNKDGDTELYTSYQITFCPGGVNGLPSGAQEGRSTAP